MTTRQAPSTSQQQLFAAIIATTVAATDHTVTQYILRAVLLQDELKASTDTIICYSLYPLLEFTNLTVAIS